MTAGLAEPREMDPAALNAAVGRRLRAVRVSRGRSIISLATQAGCSESMIRNWEHGHRGISLTRLSDLCAILGVRVVDLLTGGPEDPWCGSCGRTL